MPDASAVPTPAEIAAAVHVLETSRDALQSRCAALPAAAWAASDGPGRWTVTDILEHLVILERSALPTQQKLLAQPPEPDWATRTAGREAVLPKVALAEVKIVAPPPIQPQGGQAPAALLAEFTAARNALIAFAARPGQDLKAHTREHPVLGTINGYQLLLAVGYHTQRHLAQMDRCIAEA